MYWLLPGVNTMNTSLCCVIVLDACDVRWRIDQSEQVLTLANDAWMTTTIMDQGDIDEWQAGYEHCRVNFTVADEINDGDLGLYINGRKKDWADTDEAYFEIEPDDFSDGVNYISIKGRNSDETRAIIENVSLEVRLLTGEPILVCHKEVIPDSINLFETAVVRNYISNAGLNNAIEIRWDDSDLPFGLEYPSGTQPYGEIELIQPGETCLIELMVIGITPGTYTFGDTTVRYENPAGENRQAQFNTITVTVQD